MSVRVLLLASIAGAFMTPNACAAPATVAVEAAPTNDADAALATLFHESDEATLRRNPLNALFRGDLRYAAQFGDYITPDYFAKERAATEAELQRLEGIDEDALTPTNKIAYEAFKAQKTIALRGLAADILAVTMVRPIDHFTGFQVFYPDVSSGEGAAPFKTVADYDNALKRHDGYVAYIDNAIAMFRQGMARGIVQPRLVVQNVIDQLDIQIAQGVENSTFHGPVAKFPAEIPEAEQTRLRAAYASAIRDRIIPAYTRLRDFLKTEYLPVARDGVGLVRMPGGDRLYAYLIEQNTTLPLTADHIHKLGLSEVARIKREMEAVRRQVGFKGSLPEFFEHIRTDPRFKPQSKEWLREEYLAIGRRVDARIPEQFSTLPKAPLEIRPVPDYREKTDAAGSYMSGTPDGSRPGIFYYNSYDLPSRTTPGMETLYLHEAVPGHHFQISLAQENDALPAFMRFDGNTAYVEGWALYAESLWKELGMETDPYQRYGGLDDEMLRAMRLVVDTGIHAKGWTRDQAIAYMLANSAMGRTDATSEVERYIAMPGQALAYKIGQLTILRLKDKAEKALGDRFDPRAFHAEVLMTGALPMTVLEQKIDDWIARTRAARP